MHAVSTSCLIKAPVIQSHFSPANLLELEAILQQYYKHCVEHQSEPESSGWPWDGE